MERALVLQQAANKLFAAENSIDKAMADASLLIMELQKVRTELNLSAIFADEATSKAALALATLAQARTAMVAAHHEMAEGKLRLGVRTKMVGVGDKPPSKTAVYGDHLREVG